VALFVIEKSSSEDIGKVFPLLTDAAVIGRKTGDSGPDICFYDVRVSREHAEVVYRQDCYYLRDLGSKNGTEIDGERLQPGNLYPLKHNSAIGLGITDEGPCVLLRFSASDETVAIGISKKERPKASLVDWLKINEEKKEVWVDGKPIHLSRKEFSLMLLLKQNAGRICSKDEVIAAAWPQVQEPGVISDANVDQLIHRIREKVEVNPSSPTRVVSKKGFGYMLL
jgi:hypothetical protein